MRLKTPYDTNRRASVWRAKQLLKAEPITFKYPASNLKDPAERTTNAVHVW